MEKWKVKVFREYYHFISVKMCSMPFVRLFQVKIIHFKLLLYTLYTVYTNSNMIGCVDHKIQGTKCFGRLSYWINHWTGREPTCNFWLLNNFDQIFVTNMSDIVLVPHQKLLSLLSRKYFPLTMYMIWSSYSQPVFHTSLKF